jgi:hypothetical protein
MTALYGNQPPFISFKQPRVIRRFPGKVTFDARNSSDPEGGALKFSWRFSDGTKARGPLVSKRFTKRGRYKVTLTVIDRLGERSKKSFVINVGRKQGQRRGVKPRR